MSGTRSLLWFLGLTMPGPWSQVNAWSSLVTMEAIHDRPTHRLACSVRCAYIRRRFLALLSFLVINSCAFSDSRDKMLTPRSRRTSGSRNTPEPSIRKQPVSASKQLEPSSKQLGSPVRTLRSERKKHVRRSLSAPIFVDLRPSTSSDDHTSDDHVHSPEYDYADSPTTKGRASSLTKGSYPSSKGLPSSTRDPSHPPRDSGHPRCPTTPQRSTSRSTPSRPTTTRHDTPPASLPVPEKIPSPSLPSGSHIHRRSPRTAGHPPRTEKPLPPAPTPASAAPLRFHVTHSHNLDQELHSAPQAQHPRLHQTSAFWDRRAVTPEVGLYEHYANDMIRDALASGPGKTPSTKRRGQYLG